MTWQMDDKVDRALTEEIVCYLQKGIEMVCRDAEEGQLGYEKIYRLNDDAVRQAKSLRLPGH